MPKNIHDFNALRHLNNNNLITSTNIIQTCMPHMGTDDDVTLLYIINGLPRLKAVLAQRNAKPEKDKEESIFSAFGPRHSSLSPYLILSDLTQISALLWCGRADMLLRDSVSQYKRSNPQSKNKQKSTTFTQAIFTCLLL